MLKTPEKNMSVLIHAMDPFDFPKPVPFDPAKSGFCPEKARMLLLCSRLVYEDPAAIGELLSGPGWHLNPEEDFRFISKDHTQLFMMKLDSSVFVVFRGTETENFWDWRIDADVRQCVDSVIGERGGLVHKGFSDGLESVWEPVRKTLDEWSRSGVSSNVLVSGHSLGAALAELAAVRIACTYGCERIASVYTFGKPRVGNAVYVDFMTTLLGSRFFAIVNRNDIVPRIPPEKWGYKPSGTLCCIDDDHRLQVGKDWLTDVPEYVGDHLELVTRLFRSEQMETFVKRLERHSPSGIWLGIGKALKRLPPGLLDSLKKLIPQSLVDHFPGEYLKAFSHGENPKTPLKSEL